MSNRIQLCRMETTWQPACCLNEGIKMPPEDNPADDVQPTKEELEAFENVEVIAAAKLAERRRIITLLIRKPLPAFELPIQQQMALWVANAVAEIQDSVED